MYFLEFLGRPDKFILFLFGVLTSLRLYHAKDRFALMHDKISYPNFLETTFSFSNNGLKVWQY